jgi:hypothetical protein
MRTDAKGQARAEALQEFTDKALTDPAELAALSGQLRRPGRGPNALWLAVAGAAAVLGLVAGLLLGRVLLP